MIYKVEEIFEEIPEDPTHIRMNIPEELIMRLNWKEGDILTIRTEHETIVITKHG